MAKKNPYVFTIGFDETDPVHVRAAEILNGTKKKAQLIAAAILSYVDGADLEKIPDFHVESFQPLSLLVRKISLQIQFWIFHLKKRKWMKA